jgi:hypothetical protein
MIISGMPRFAILSVNATHGPVIFRHDLATMPAEQRFNHAYPVLTPKERQ